MTTDSQSLEKFFQLYDNALDNMGLDDFTHYIVDPDNFHIDLQKKYPGLIIPRSRYGEEVKVFHATPQGGSQTLKDLLLRAEKFMNGKSKSYPDAKNRGELMDDLRFVEAIDLDDGSQFPELKGFAILSLGS